MREPIIIMAFDFPTIDEMLEALETEAWDTVGDDYPDFDVEKEVNFGKDDEGNDLYTIEVKVYDKREQ